MRLRQCAVFQSLPSPQAWESGRSCRPAARTSSAPLSFCTSPGGCGTPPRTGRFCRTPDRPVRHAPPLIFFHRLRDCRPVMLGHDPCLAASSLVLPPVPTAGAFQPTLCAGEVIRLRLLQEARAILALILGHFCSIQGQQCLLEVNGLVQAFLVRVLQRSPDAAHLERFPVALHAELLALADVADDEFADGHRGRVKRARSCTRRSSRSFCPEFLHSSIHRSRAWLPISSVVNSLLLRSM